VISALTRVDNRVLELSVPGAAQGEFYRVFTRLGETRKTLVIPAAMQMDDGRYEPAIGDRLAGERREQGPHVGPRLAPRADDLRGRLELADPPRPPRVAIVLQTLEPPRIVAASPPVEGCRSRQFRERYPHCRESQVGRDGAAGRLRGVRLDGRLHPHAPACSGAHRGAGAGAGRTLAVVTGPCAAVSPAAPVGYTPQRPRDLIS
jgi:hypothetical protein